MPKVLIHSSHALFRDGLRKLIGDVASVQTVASLEETERLARAAAVDAGSMDPEPVDAVILDQGDADALVIGQAVARLLAVPGLKVITVSLDADAIQIYSHEIYSSHEEVGPGALKALLQAIVPGNRQS